MPVLSVAEGLDAGSWMLKKYRFLSPLVNLVVLNIESKVFEWIQETIRDHEFVSKIPKPETQNNEISLRHT